jgi:hypothetical protein
MRGPEGKKDDRAAGPVSRIRRAALQTDKLFEISLLEVSMMSTLSVLAGFASHRRHNASFEADVATEGVRPRLLAITSNDMVYYSNYTSKVRYTANAASALKPGMLKPSFRTIVLLPWYVPPSPLLPR